MTTREKELTTIGRFKKCFFKFEIDDGTRPTPDEVVELASRSLIGERQWSLKSAVSAALSAEACAADAKQFLTQYVTQLSTRRLVALRTTDWVIDLRVRALATNTRKPEHVRSNATRLVVNCAKWRPSICWLKIAAAPADPIRQQAVEHLVRWNRALQSATNVLINDSLTFFDSQFVPGRRRAAMTKRVLALESVDPISVPLPHGTEVTTRVEKMSGERRIPQGLIGRVVRERDGGFDIHIAGVGEVWFLRNEIAPRRIGQLAFAMRRERAWEALRTCTVVETTVGSRAWGLADEASDTDVRGAFTFPFRWLSGVVEVPRELVSADGSQTFWETSKMVEQGLRADPNTMEMLFVKSARPVDEMGEWILAERQAFVSKLIFGSFGRYALSQLDKLNKTQKLAEYRDDVFAWICAQPDIELDQVAGRLSTASPRQFSSQNDALAAAKTYIKQLYRSLSDQGLIAANDFASLKEYALNGGRRPPESRELRPKNAYNLLRLIALATGWLKSGEPQFEATGAFRERLLTIKKGAVALPEVLAEAESMSPALEEAYRETRLPERPDVGRAHRLLQRIHQEVGKRWFEESDSAWGLHAPMPPEPPKEQPS